MDEIASAARTLTGMTKVMQEQISRFKTSEAETAMNAKPVNTDDEDTIERISE